LAMNSSICPVLESLSLTQCPEWDVYFIMLETRLLGSTSDVPGFKVLHLPSYIPPDLLSITCGVLQGKLPVRPSNFDLSLIGNTEISLDVTM
ncbi:hypothetical protein CPB86DRAFT_686859, partial [Serendipita vermifera]